MSSSICLLQKVLLGVISIWFFIMFVHDFSIYVTSYSLADFFHSKFTWRSFSHMTSFHRIIPVIFIFNYCSWRVAMFNLQWTAWASSSWLHDDRNRIMFIECGFEISSAGLHKARFQIKTTFFRKYRIFAFFWKLRTFEETHRRRERPCELYVC